MPEITRTRTQAGVTGMRPPAGGDYESWAELAENIDRLNRRMALLEKPPSPLAEEEAAKTLTERALTRLREMADGMLVKLRWLEQMMWILWRRKGGGMNLIYVLQLPRPDDFSPEERENGIYAYWLGPETGIEHEGQPGEGDDQIWVLPPYSPRWYPWNRYTNASGFVFHPE